MKGGGGGSGGKMTSCFPPPSAEVRLRFVRSLANGHVPPLMTAVVREDRVCLLRVLLLVVAQGGSLQQPVQVPSPLCMGVTPLGLRCLMRSIPSFLLVLLRAGMLKDVLLLRAGVLKDGLMGG